MQFLLLNLERKHWIKFVDKLQLTQSSAFRFKHVRAHCSPTSPTPAVEQLKYTFGGLQAVTSEKMFVCFFIHKVDY